MIENLEEALAATRGLSPTPNEIVRIGQRFGPEAARAAFEQWELRRRARGKFARADEMFFIREALEQATHERVAAYHASLFPQGVTVTDMTAGIGADLIALAARGSAVGYELDPLRAEYARRNLAAHGLQASVYVRNSLEADLGEYAFVDPARRVAGSRTTDLHAFSPDPFEVADRLRTLKLGVMKLGPGTPDSELDQFSPRVEFVSFGGECREALAIFGSDPWRGTVQIETGARLATGPPPEQGEAQDWLFDPDPAAVRAGATGTLGREHSLWGLGGYLTGPEPIASPWVRPYRILWVGRPDRSDINAALKKHDAHVFESKSRAGGSEAEKLAKTLRSGGERPVSLVTWRTGARVTAALLRPP